MQEIQIQPVANQTIDVSVGGQYCKINLYQKPQGLFADLNANGIEIFSGVICLDRVKLVRSAYLGFIGNLIFTDTQGLSDPEFPGFGGRYALVYLDEAENG